MSETEPVYNSPITVADRFAGQLLRAAVDALNAQRVPWSITPQVQQEQTLAALKARFAEVIITQMRAVSAADMPHAEVLLQNIAAKGDSVKITVTVSERKVLHELIDFLGRKTTLVLADLEVYTAGMESFVAKADQAPLDFGDTA
jgi:Tfp pilus assembly protein PilN